MDAPPLHYPAQRAAGEPLATLDDILTCSDLPEVTVRVDFWRKHGRAMAVRVRGLDLSEQEQARACANRAVPAEDRALGSTQHWPTFVVMTLALAIVSPRLTVEQAQKLASKNASACEQLADLAWNLSALSQDYIDATFADAVGLDLAARGAPAA